MEFKSLKRRLNVWFFLVALVPLVVVISVIYQQRVESIKTEAFSKLIAIRDLKVSQVKSWITEKSGDVQLLAEVPEVRLLSNVMGSGKLSSQEIQVLSVIEENFKARIKNYRDYTEIFLISAQTGKVVVSSREDSIGADRSRNAFFLTPMETGSFFIKDIHYSKTMNRTALTFSAPVFAYEDKDKLIGIVVARIDLNQSLYTMLLDRPGMGVTGETLIVNKNSIALNELRWYDNAPLNLEILAHPALMAANGKTGITEDKDYRGKNVLAAYTYISEPGWGFVAKQDLDEIYRPIEGLVRNCLIIFCISTLTVYLVSLFVARNIAAPLSHIANVGRELSRGNLTTRIGLRRADELGSLAVDLDSMADILVARLKIQKDLSDVMESVVGSEGLNEFTQSILQRLTDITSAEIGSVYLHNSTEKKFSPVACLGISKEDLESTGKASMPGEISRAIELGRVDHIKDIPEDTVFLFNTIAGKAVPREIITIPLVIKEKTVGVISLATLKEFSADHVEFISNLLPGLNAGLSNLLANNRTKELAENLEAINVELEQQKGELQRQSDELQEQNVELNLQRAQVEEANRLKSEFLSNMSHELRTPLNSVMSLSKVLIGQAAAKLSEDELNYLNVIERNGKKLLDLVNDILDLSKIEAGKMDAVVSLFSMDSIIESIVESLAVICTEKGIQIKQTIPSSLPLVESDQGRLHQILQNVISNAVKFTTEGSISVLAETDNRNIIIKIKDTGIGIDEQDLPHIFNEFRQVDGSHARNFEGTGLGLAIAKKAIALLGGEISVASKLGFGSVFTIQFPLSWPGNGLATQVEYMNVIQSPKTLRRVSNRAKAAGKQDNNILIVEDNEETIIQVRSALENAGYNVTTAIGGAEALQAIDKEIPDGIIMDLMMPEVDGFEVIDSLRSTEETAQIPVLVLTAKDLDRNDLKRLSANNIQQLVQKGDIDLDGLLNKIQLMIESQLELTVLPPEPAPVEVPVVQNENIPGKHDKPILLAVEDNPDNMITLKAVLNGRYEILEATDGEAGLKMTIDHQPDLVLLDIALPKMDGFAVVRAIRKNPNLKSIPVLALTASAMSGDREKVLAAGCDDYLSKPIEPETLIECIEKFLKKARNKAE